MESLKDIQLKKCYDSDQDNLLVDFLIPILSVAKHYQRMAGFFSSGILSAAARGVSELIKNDGKMDLIVGAQIHEEDLAAMEKSTQSPEDYAERILMNELDKAEDFLRNEHVEALGWMLANNLLEIRIALANNSALFHMKVGIVEDHQGNKLSFSGSDNETPSGWKHNIEEFKVFRAWVESESEYYESDVSKFQKFWFGQGYRVKTVDLPYAVKKKLIKGVPKTRGDLQIIKKVRMQAIPAPKRTAPAEDAKARTQVQLRDYQKEAISQWIRNKYRGVFAMATGTGKTWTALGAVRTLLDEGGIQMLVVAVPQKHLGEQWIEDIETQIGDETFIIRAYSGGDAKWAEKLTRQLASLTQGAADHIVTVVTTYASLSGTKFQSILDSHHDGESRFLLIADEMHNMGAPKHSTGMHPAFSLRLGLSATPVRQYDEEGTERLISYFGKTVYTFSLARAIKEGRLTPYRYYPVTAQLTEDETKKYEELTDKIQRLSRSRRDDDVKLDDSIKHFCIMRSNVLKGSSSKTGALHSIVSDLQGKGDARYLIVYCNEGIQLADARAVLDEAHLVHHKFTKDESLKERAAILKAFADGTYDVLLAVKCLDEGVNIPEARRAILLASASSTREYVQRRGRLMRTYKGKEFADIYDVVVLPPEGASGYIRTDTETKIVSNEFTRIGEFLADADNKLEIMNTVAPLVVKYGVKLEKTSHD